jgi:hypothetical protein
MKEEWSGEGSRDMDGAQLGCWREHGRASDQLRTRQELFARFRIVTKIAVSSSH